MTWQSSQVTERSLAGATRSAGVAVTPSGSRREYAALAALCLATPLLIPMAWWGPGLAAWAVSAVLVGTSPRRAFRQRMAPLLAVVLLLAVVPIDTDLSNTNFVRLGGAFLAAVLIPYLWLRRTQPGVIEYQIFPRRLSRVEVFYVLLSIPLAWVILDLYFFKINPFMPQQWPITDTSSNGQVLRLFLGINCVGIWDELFFINTVYAILRSLFPARTANLAQAVVYTSVLHDMAFIGIGSFIVYGFAVIQGAMYERTRKLVYVLAVHLIVDAFLVAAILRNHGSLAGKLWF
jgi:membrane protease YdiL (CAAX protease family)